MSYFRLFVSFLLVILVSTNKIDASKKLTEKEIEQKIDSLLSIMTLEEKIGQMTNIGFPAVCKNQGYWVTGDTLIADTAKLRLLVGKYKVGSIQNKGAYPPTKEEWYRLTKFVQDWNMKNSRLKIPILFGIDGVHGANYTAGSTLFPQQIAVAATWEPNFAEKTGEITSYELRASNLPWNYAPVLDVARHPLWGRTFETFGEDTYLATIMANAFIKGSQGDNIGEPTKVGICLKHFAGYGAPTSGKDRSNASLSNRTLRQYHFPPFESAIKNGAMNVMINSGAVDYVPCHANKWLLTDVLKDEFKFKGFTISDWNDIDNLVHADNIAEDRKEATMLAINAGLDMSMVPYDESFSIYLAELVKEGKVSIARIDDATRRILRFKFMLNLFETPTTNPADYPKFGSDEFANESYKAALECFTLLKNSKETLPLKKGSKLFVTGPAGNSITWINGGWSRDWSGQNEAYADKNKKTVFQALQDKFGKDNVTFEQGTQYMEEINIAKAVEAAKKADYIVACVGEIPATEKPSDVDELELPEAQQNLVKELSKLNKPIILVIFESRPRVIRKIEPLVSVVINGYLPGNEGGRAFAELITGDANFSGKLPYTYPRFSNDIIHYNHKTRDKIGKTFNPDAYNPQYEFGFGLSYTTFEYSDLKISTDSLVGDANLTITINVKNTGKVKGKEVVECYTRDVVASIEPDQKKLVRFTKIELNPGETKTVTFTINKTDLAFVGLDEKWVTEPGKFDLMVGGNPSALKTTSFKWNK